jgi:alkyl sulfatase BDS1-like metallo-beta-lactamase superfamily hydrolase
MNRNGITLAVAVFLMFSFCAFVDLARSAQTLTPAQKLQQHDETEFRKEIIKVTDGVWQAVGYACGQPTLLEGTDGVVIVDTPESTTAAEEIKAEFDKITKKPIKAVIYTHSHRDHVGSTKVFIGDQKIDIYSREFTADLLGDKRVMPILRKRTNWQFGADLDLKERISSGICPANRPTTGLGAGYVPPNKPFRGDHLELEISGIRMELVAAPGETPDTLFVWLPEKKVLLCADDYYKSFPNLYAIRGTKYRDNTDWVESLDKMLKYDAEYLVAGHTRPIVGAGQIKQTLTGYRDAIRYVLDKTIEGMNKGLTPDELVAYVQLPPNLADKPYLQEYFGVVAWSVRAIFDGLMGWFDGNPTNLFPLSPREEAKHIAAMAGGEKVFGEQARKALTEGDYQWACEMTDYMLALEPGNVQAKQMKAEALEKLAVQQISSNARNYYFGVAKELRKSIANQPK